MYTFIVLINLFYHRYLKYLITVSFYALPIFSTCFFLNRRYHVVLATQNFKPFKFLASGKNFFPNGGGRLFVKYVGTVVTYTLNRCATKQSINL